MDQEFYRRHSVTEMKEDSSKSLSAAARRSFFRRKQKHKRSSSKDSKEMVALDAISTDSIPFLDGEETVLEVIQQKKRRVIQSLFFASDCVSLAYQRVQKVECTSPRPVLVLGPLTDAVKEMLVKESPGKYCRCILGELRLIGYESDGRTTAVGFRSTRAWRNTHISAILSPFFRPQS